MALLLILQELLIKKRNGGSWSRNIHFNNCETFFKDIFYLKRVIQFYRFLAKSTRKVCIHIFKSKQTKLLTELQLILIFLDGHLEF